MNTTQINAMRNLWETATRAEETMTVREMALSSDSIGLHSVGQPGETVTMKDGRVFYWNDSRFLWVR